MKKLLILISVVGLGFIYRELTISNPDLVLFVSQTCPHCQNVEDYIKTTKINDKIKIDLKEVNQQPDNQQLLQNTANNCQGLDISQGIGLPLAYFPGTNTCLTGDTPIIDRLSQMVK